jgi:hypothetical protein
MSGREPHIFRSGTISLIGSDVLHIVYTKNAKLEVEDILQVRNFRIQEIGEHPFYSILEMSEGIAKASNEAKAWMAVNKESAVNRVMDVFLVSNRVMKLKIKLYMLLYKPKTETYIVNTLEEALAKISESRNKRNR